MPENEISEKLFNEIPEDILDLIQSREMPLKISEICIDNGIEEDEKIREIAYQTGRVLLGDLSPEEFPKILAEKVKLSVFSANKIAREINDSIFYSVNEILAKFYKITPPEKPSAVPPLSGPPEEKPKGPDIYREPVE